MRRPGQVFQEMRWAMGAAALSGVLQVLPFPIAGPVPLWRTHVCWFALLPLLWALVGSEGEERSWWQGAGLGYLSGVVWYLGSCYWVFQTMHLYGGLTEAVSAGILVLFAMYLGLYHAVFGAAVALVRRSRMGRQGALLLVPVLWVAVELLRSRVTGFPWDLLGVTQVDSPVLRRLAPWTGVYGMSFVIAAVNALWLLRLQVRDRRWTRPALTAAGVVLVAVYAVMALRVRRPVETGAEQGAATLLQENLEVGAAAQGQLPESAGQMMERFSALSERPSALLLAGTPEVPGTKVIRRRRQVSVVSGAAGPEVMEPTDLVVWPESPAPFEESQIQFREGMSALARRMGAPVIVGNIGVDRGAGGAPVLYNSASFVRPDGSFARRYDKMHLVPFGEYVPYKRLFFFAGHLLDEVGTFTPGAERRVFATGGHRYGVFICYESIFGDEVREFPAMGADVLVNISNDGWYGDTSAPWQHLNMVRMRAVETHRWVLRATNTGVTGAIDTEGRVVAAAPRHVRTAVRVPFFYERDETFYVRHGDWFAWVCLLGGVGAAGYAMVRRAT